MKKMRIVLSLLVALLVLCAMMATVSCSGDDSSNPPSSSDASSKNEGDSSVPDSSVTGGSSSDSGTSGSTDNSTGSGSSSTGSSNGGSQGGDDQSNKSNYTVLILDANTGKPIPNVSVYLQDEASYEAIAYARGKTNENGVCVLSAEAKYAKYVYVEGFKKGYVYEDFYALGATGVEIKVSTEIIENTNNSFAGKELALGDVMYDFDMSAYVYNKETGKIETTRV